MTTRPNPAIAAECSIESEKLAEWLVSNRLPREQLTGSIIRIKSSVSGIPGGFTWPRVADE